MVQRGRPTSVASIVGRLKGSLAAKQRVLVVLENLGGTLPVAEACRRLCFSRTLFRRYREALLLAAIQILEPRPRGRPVRRPPAASRRILELEEKNRLLEEDLAFTRVREELALLVPWTQRRQKKHRRFPASSRAPTPSGSPAATGVTGAVPGQK
jgi:hypothetical protein